MDELKRVQLLRSRKYGEWLDERRYPERVQLYKQFKALEEREAQLKVELSKNK